jgi:hypothetical protein
MTRGYPDYEGEKQKVYLTPEWAALLGVDKNFDLSATLMAFGDHTEGVYAVPVGKTLYICGISGASTASAAADGDKEAHLLLRLIHNPSGGGATTYLFYMGGNGGAGLTFPKPIVIEGNYTVEYRIFNMSNYNCTLSLTLWGYEL